MLFLPAQSDNTFGGAKEMNKTFGGAKEMNKTNNIKKVTFSDALLLSAPT
jgi:CRISPR/Cas system CMR subunit Cmr4 (Cas7 group RAMP superfamily)